MESRNKHKKNKKKASNNFKTHDTSFKPNSTINKIQPEIQMNNIHLEYVYSIIQLTDKRIVTGSINSLLICSVNILTKCWNVDITKESAHNGKINSLCELTNNRLISGSDDELIKIWLYSSKDLSFIKQISKHKGFIYKIINLTNNIFATCSQDQTVKLFEHNENYQELLSIKSFSPIISIINLQKRKQLVIASRSSFSSNFSFWDTDSYVLIHDMNNYYFITAPSHMVELPNGNIAVSSNDERKPIVIINVIKYSIDKIIYCEEMIKSDSSLCVINNCSFIYLWNGNILQISSKDYSIIYKYNKLKGLDGWYSMITIENGNYLVITNPFRGISIVKMCYA
jgi:hypothetical protein